MRDRRCLVAICHNGPVVFSETARSLMEIGWGDRVQIAKEAHGFAAIDFAWCSSFPRVDAMRDWMVAQAKKHPAGYTHLLFLDADMVWPSDVLVKMLAHHDKGIVSGLYMLKSGDFAPVAMRNGVREDGSAVTQYTHDRDYRETEGLRPQEIVGMGCTLIPMDVFDAIGERPWFVYEDDDAGWPRVSEDVPFCRKAAEAGYAISLDASVKCGHVSTKTITERWHRAASDSLPQVLMESLGAQPV